MKNYSNPSPFLTETALRAMFFLTLTLGLFTSVPGALAVDNGSNPSSAVEYYATNGTTPLASDEQHRRLSLMVNYLRQQGTAILPQLPEAVRLPAQLALNDITSLRDEIGITPEVLQQEKAIAAIVQPVSNWVQPPTENQEDAYWISPTYHHKGFIPLHDAMVLGFNARHFVGQGLLQVDTHPFFGQNWHSAGNYYGIESTVSVFSPFRSNTSHEPSLGKISVRLIGGDSQMMDQRPGFDMHTELHFTDSVSLNAGVRQGDAIGLGNYVMVRWQLVSFGQP